MDGKIERVAVCRYCGQSKLIQLDEDLTDEQLEEKVTLECNCKLGREYRAKIEDEKKTEQMVRDTMAITYELLGDDLPELENLINDVIPKMVEKNIEKATFSVGKVKVSIRYSGDEIKISRTETNKCEDKASK